MDNRNGLNALSGMFLEQIEAPAESEQKEEVKEAVSEEVPPTVEEPEAHDDVDELAGIDETDDDSDDAGSQVQAEVPRKYKVKVDGDEFEVDEAELKSGYSRNSDYTRKTTKLAEERKAFDAEKSELQRERELYAQILGNWEAGLESTLKEFVPADLDELRQYDPEKYIELNEKLQRHQKTLENIKSEKSRVDFERDKENRQKFDAYIKSESEKLFDKIPEWKDEAVRQKEVRQVTDYVKNTFGFTDDDINGTYSHALWVAMRESMKYRQIVERRNRVNPAVKVKTSEPGSTPSPDSRAKKVDKAAQKLKKSGKVGDYAALLLEQMQD